MYQFNPAKSENAIVKSSNPLLTNAIVKSAHAGLSTNCHSPQELCLSQKSRTLTFKSANPFSTSAILKSC